jgi:hypothetical protein
MDVVLGCVVRVPEELNVVICSACAGTSAVKVIGEKYPINPALLFKLLEDIF